MAVLLISAQASYATELRCDNTQLAKQVVEHRNVFNKAIKDADLSKMAMEHGNWVGQLNADVLFSGSYTAKWRLNKEQQTWLLEAEVYMTSYNR